jgi:DNA-binding GntR family transcriptional regulator
MPADDPQPWRQQPLSKTEYVLERLRHELANGEIHPGQQLRQVDIAERYGVSPTPVREALRLLEADGAIQYAPHRGATVTELTPQELGDLYLIRSALEAQLARLAAERATPKQVAAIRKQHEALGDSIKTESAVELSRLNREFHLAVLRLGSPLITQLVVTPLWHGFLPPTKGQWRSPEDNRTFVAEHEALVRALENADPDAAEAAMATHLHTAMEMRARDGDSADAPAD